MGFVQVMVLHIPLMEKRLYLAYLIQDLYFSGMHITEMFKKYSQRSNLSGYLALFFRGRENYLHLVQVM